MKISNIIPVDKLESYLLEELKSCQEYGASPNQITEDMRDEPEAYEGCHETALGIHNADDLDAAIKVFCFKYEIPMDSPVE